VASWRVWRAHTTREQEARAVSDGDTGAFSSRRSQSLVAASVFVLALILLAAGISQVVRGISHYELLLFDQHGSEGLAGR
jgi:hypothetical protein